MLSEYESIGYNGILANRVCNIRGVTIPEAWAGVMFTAKEIDAEKILTWFKTLVSIYSSSYIADDAVIGTYASANKTNVVLSSRPIVSSIRNNNWDNYALHGIGPGHLIRYAKLIESVNNLNL